jgi:membrane protein DedA with SNARE-associated domain
MTAFLHGAGYPMLGLLVLLGALGLPLPLAVALAAAGAMARQGQMSLPGLFVLCTLAAVSGDCLGYAVGRFGVARIVRYTPESWRIRAISLIAALRRRTRSIKAPRAALSMGMLVFLTRWALTAPGSVVNVLAGVRRYAWEDFLLWDALGESLWVAIALVPGYILGSNGSSGLILAIAAGGLVGVAVPLLAEKISQHLRMSRHRHPSAPRLP